MTSSDHFPHSNALKETSGKRSPHLSDEDGSVLENAGWVTVTATVSLASPVPFTVTVSADPVAPATEDDFRLSSNQVLSFAANATESTGTVRIGPIDDDDPEPDDIVRVSGAVSNAAIQDPDDVTLTIVNEDAEAFDVAVSAPTAVDEDAGTATVTVTLTTRQNSAPVIDVELYYYWRKETATRGEDYRPPPGEVFISNVLFTTVPTSAFSPNAAGTAWEAERTFTIGIVDDQEAEADEAIVFYVSTRASNSPNHTITIRDDDTPVMRNVTLVSGPGSDGVWSVGERVELEVRYTLPVVVEQPEECWSYNADGTCKPPGPFVAVVFRSDARPGYGEGLSVALAPYVGELGGSGMRVLRFAYTVGAAEDGALGVVVVDGKVLLRGATISPLGGGDDVEPEFTRTRVMQVNVRKPGGSAWTAGDAVRVNVRFAGPEAAASNQPPNRDKVEVNEAGGTPSIGLRLGDGETRTLARAAQYMGGSGSNTLRFEYEVTAGDGQVNAAEVEANTLALNGATIRNERGYDAELGHLSAVGYGSLALLVRDAAAALEGETLKFTMELVRASEAPVTVDYETADGTATAGEDYTAERGTVRFAPGGTRKTVEVAVLRDEETEDAETVVLRLSNARSEGSEEPVEVTDPEAEGTIEDVAPAAELTAEFRDMPETHDGESAFTFRVAFSEDIGISFRALREDAFTVTGGRVTGGSRVDGRRDLFKMTVRPDSDGDVTITLAAGRECVTSGAICTKGENRRQLTNSPSATVKGPAASSAAADVRVGDIGAGSLCSAVGSGAEMTQAALAAALWEGGDMSEDQLAALDSLGNGNGTYDLGDLLAWINRCRPGSGSAAGTGPLPSPPPALPASGPAGGASRRRKGARGPARHRRTVPDPPATGSATRRSGWLRTALLAVVISVWGCGDGIVDPRNDAPRYDGANAAVVDPGPLHVRLTAPAQARDIGAMLIVEGPAIDSLQAPGLEMFETDESSSTRREVIIAGALPDAPVLRVWVPHRGDEARYRVRLLQVAGEDFALRDLSVYGSVISR